MEYECSYCGMYTRPQAPMALARTHLPGVVPGFLDVAVAQGEVFHTLRDQHIFCGAHARLSRFLNLQEEPAAGCGVCQGLARACRFRTHNHVLVT
jgi:hypothetical protein